MRRGLLLILLLLLAPAVQAEPDVETLVKGLTGEDSTKRFDSYRELLDRKDPRAVPLLVAALPGAELMGQYYGVLILDQYPQDLTKKAFASLVQAEAPYLRLGAGTALYRLGDRKMLPVVVKALLTEGVEKQARIYMLNRVMMVPDPRMVEAVLTFVVPGEDLAVLASAMNILNSRMDQRSKAACESLLADPRPGARAMALALLYRLGEEHRGSALAKLIEEEEMGYSEFMRVRNFLYVMNRLSLEILAAVTVLLETSEDVNILNRAIELVAKFRYRKAIPAIRNLLDHKSRTVANEAFEALAGFPGALDAETLRPLLSAEDVDRRLRAAEALRRMDDLSGFDAVVEVLKSGENQQRSDAAKTLGGFRMAKSVEPLIDALNDEYNSTRMYAESSLLGVLQALYPYRRFRLKSAGYAWNSALSTRQQAAERIRAWWAGNRDSEW